MTTCKMTAPVTGTTLRTTGPVPAYSLQGTPSVRNCVTRYKLGTDPMGVGGLNKLMDAAAEIGRNLVSKHQIQPAEYVE